ncbi:helix-turn-helix domain-containing protein [Pseudonocardia acaciae]|uniref:helix-turn-helix domain-containing protein n=1 Tax=Pseudonocardia acaciae TaxID=551276 RepID=UPI000561DF96|nr:helix-turn-helix domain-containing protein [Pseudonocardia acaciae]
MTTTAPPSPEAATDEASFVAALRRLKAWSGRSFRQLERAASAAGDALPYSTVATMLGRNSLPREELVVTFARACGLDGDEARRWTVVRAAIADRAAAGAVLTDGATAPRRRLASRWWPAVAGAAALAIAFACGVAVASGFGGDSVEEQETVIGAP